MPRPSRPPSVEVRNNEAPRYAVFSFSLLVPSIPPPAPCLRTPSAWLVNIRSSSKNLSLCPPYTRESLRNESIGRNQAATVLINLFWFCIKLLHSKSRTSFKRSVSWRDEWGIHSWLSARRLVGRSARGFLQQNTCSLLTARLWAVTQSLKITIAIP